MHSPSWRVILSLPLFLAGACTGTEDLEPPDGGPTADTGSLDTGPRADTGLSPDGGSPADGGADSGVAADSGVVELEVELSSCPHLAGLDDPRPVCGRVQVPLQWDRPEGPTIELYVKKVPASAPAGRSLWILTGGPGQAGVGAEGLARVITAEDPGVTVWLPDHRGTGASTRLECRAQESLTSPGGRAIVEAEWPACREALVEQWGEGLGAFRTTEAARDVVGLIEATREPGEQVFVLGVSYGTYLANRYLQVAPNQAAGVIFDSVCPPDHCFLSDQDLGEDQAAEQLFGLCAQDPTCSAHLGPDPWATFGEVMTRLAQGHCRMGLGGTEATVINVRSLAGTMMMHAVIRRALPAVVHRLDRCNTEDRAAISALFNALFSPPPEGAFNPMAGYSWPLGINILSSELWSPEMPTPEQLHQRWEDTLSCRGVGRQLAWMVPGWPTYQEPLALTRAVTDRPLLILNADLDPATPAELARSFGQHYTGPHQHYVEIPGSSHTTIAQGPLRSDQSKTCGRRLLHQFIEDPEGPLDTSCVAETIPTGFTLSATTTRVLFGTTNLWGD